MRISANTLFHFTKQFEYFKEMLQGSIQPRYCLEYFRFIKDPRLRYVGIPMSCFCDIPLSQITNHIDNYGKFAIGMTKEWAKAKGITPIQYTIADSDIVQYDIVQYINDNIEDKRRQLNIALYNTKNPQPIQDVNFHNIISSISHVLSYLKPVKGSMCKDATLQPNIHFYDEREWRYVPDMTQCEFLDKETFYDETKNKEANKTLKSFSLSYDMDKVKDIKYIIMPQYAVVKFEEFIDKKEILKPHKSLLLSKVITIEQIKEDF